ncbi:hypothetical protein K502DRAFT_368856 [Neoconidiobolus thromboides FSU 785]|nr:hypothetical protein K502DRAFT_368856 [Neoconidiobolus thromboides FSU 785]
MVLILELPLHSGLLVNCEVRTVADIMDIGYRREVYIVLFNHDYKALLAPKGDRITQLILGEIVILKIEFLDESDVTLCGNKKSSFIGTRKRCL